MEALAPRIRQLRTDRKLSQAELGRRVGVSRRVISTWEAGREVPAGDLPRLAAALGVPVADLYGAGPTDRRTFILDANVLLVLGAGLSLQPRDLDALRKVVLALVTPAIVTTNFDELMQNAVDSNRLDLHRTDSDLVDEKPTAGSRFMRNFVREWREMSDEERREIEAFLREEEAER